MAEPLYTAGLVARSDQRPLDVINELAEAMGGKVCFSGNQLRMMPAAYTAPALSLGDDDFAPGPVQVQPRVPREQLFNVVKATLLDPANGWQPVDMPIVEAPAYVEADGTELPIQVEYGAVHRVGQAQQLSAVALREARQALTVTASFKLTAYRVEVFDVISLTCSRYGWLAKPFLVLARQWSLDGLIRLTLREIDATIYSFGNTFDEVDAAPNTTLPSYKQVPELEDLAVESGLVALEDGSQQTRVRVSFTATADRSVLDGGKVEVQYIEAGSAFPSGDWPSQKEEGNVSEVVIVGLRQNVVYVFRARWISALGVRGKWSSPHKAHQVASVETQADRTYRAVSVGYDATGNAPHAAGLYDGGSGAQLMAASRSYSLARIRRSDGEVVFTQGYDVYGGGAAVANTMAAALDATASDHIVCVIGYDEPRDDRLTTALYAAMKRCGASAGVFGSPQFKSRAAYVLVGIAGCGEGNGSEFYQGSIDSDPQAWQDVSFQVINGGLFVGGGAAPRSLQDYGYFGDLEATRDLALQATGNMTLAGNKATKNVPSSGAWDGEVRSVDSVTGACFASIIVGANNVSLMFGLNSDPTSSSSYESLDYAIYCQSGGLLDVYESGVPVSIGLAYTGSDALLIAYDGANVVYQKNGTPFRTVAAAAGKRLFFDSSVYSPGAVMHNIRFGPLSAVTGIGTGQLTPGAATNVHIATSALAFFAPLAPPAPLYGSEMLSYTVGPYDVDTKVLALGTLDAVIYLNGTSQNSCSAWIAGTNLADAPFYTSPTRLVGMVRSGAGWSDTLVSAAVDGAFDLPAGTQAKVILVGGPTEQWDPFSTWARASNLQLRVEVIKR